MKKLSSWNWLKKDYSPIKRAEALTLEDSRLNKVFSKFEEFFDDRSEAAKED